MIRLICREHHGYGICKGFLDFNCGEARAPDQDQNFREAFQLSASQATIRRHNNSEQKPSWQVVAHEESILDDVEPEQPYCVVVGLAACDKLTVTFSIADKDAAGREEYVRWSDGNPLGRNKKAILDRISKHALLNDDNGELVLCRHEVTFDHAYAAQRAAGLTGGREPESE